ncbi:MAG: hypothetical protein M3680_03240 [Myxococcota bacterium]|nr:hypothetical protein [Myxococcota bacterium]
MTTSLSIAELPFHERPVIELLALDRDEPDPEYAGYGWARVERLWLAAGDDLPRRIDDALVIAVHAADDGEALGDDIELDFEIDGEVVASVLASTFLDTWLPKLPQDCSAIVLAMCNPFGAKLRRPGGLRSPLHHGLSDVFAWLDLDEGTQSGTSTRIRLAADAWRILRPVSTELEVRRPNAAITDEDRLTYAGLYLLKKLDLKPADGGMKFPVVLPSELSPLDEVFQQLAVDEYVLLNTKKDRWDLTKKGIAYLGQVIDEASDLMEEFDDDDMELGEVVEELRKRRLDPMRARFIWGWYDGEFDNLVHWQEQRGVKPVERMWAFYLMGDEFWNELAAEIEGD